MIFGLVILSHVSRNLEQREKLRTDYWSHINSYLDALECPEDYFPAEYYADDEKESPHWRYSSWHRTRVVNWLISCATSEAFGDISEQSQTESTPTPNVDQSALENPFPLGFSTGDLEVDSILTQLRMKLLIQLEEDQKVINAAVAQVQSVTSGKAKPLKQAKLRPHNAKPPPPQKKSNKQSGRRR